MPFKVTPPCGYIREVCYNDYVPELKRRPARKAVGAAADAEATADSPVTVTAPTEPTAQPISICPDCRASFAALLLAVMLT